MGRNCRAILSVLIPLFLLIFSTTQAYKNYTVGDDLGWYDDIENPKVDYQKWAADKSFSLGDFLIFNTDTNHSVVWTYNMTTYEQCDFSDADSSDTVEYSSPSLNNAIAPTTISVPLKKEGMNYFFSGYFDGEQCQNGQRLKINVTHGQGLPEGLNDPIDSSAPSPKGQQDDDNSNSLPDTVVPSNFNNPVPSSNAGNKTSETSGNSANLPRFGRVLMAILVSWVWLI